jgi:hypothetical protein
MTEGIQRLAEAVFFVVSQDDKFSLQEEKMALSEFQSLIGKFRSEMDSHIHIASLESYENFVKCVRFCTRLFFKS